jgi:hypothetical protein
MLAELDDLRERMRLEHAAARFNALAAQEGTDPQARAGMTGPHLCEHERWVSSGRKPPVYVLLMLAQMYHTGVLCLLGLADHENLTPQDRLTIAPPAMVRWRATSRAALAGCSA